MSWIGRGADPKTSKAALGGIQDALALEVTFGCDSIAHEEMNIWTDISFSADLPLRQVKLSRLGPGVSPDLTRQLARPLVVTSLSGRAGA
jgi:hypothetical protein